MFSKKNGASMANTISLSGYLFLGIILIGILLVFNVLKSVPSKEVMPYTEKSKKHPAEDINNDDLEKQIIAARYIKSLTYTEERNYDLALNELGKIPINIEVNQLKNVYKEYIRIYTEIGNISEATRYNKKLVDLEKLKNKE